LVDCDTDAAWARVEASARSLVAYFTPQSKIDEIFANVVGPPGSESTQVRLDRWSGMFHPNANGYAVMACNVKAAYTGASADSCRTARAPSNDLVNGLPVLLAPMLGGAGVTIQLSIGGFAFNAPVRITLYSAPVDIGTFTTDANGVLNATLRLPAAAAGVHALELQGQTPGGSGIHKQVRLSYPGRPNGGGSYATYLCCFTPSAAEDGTTGEQVDVIYHGEIFDTVTPDENGGIFIELPVFDTLDAGGIINITARSRTSGKALSTTIDPIPSVAGLWATSNSPGALALTGAGITVGGRVHSNADIAVTGARVTVSSGAEYATRLTVTGAGASVPGARKVAAGGVPSIVDVADYRPGGRRAIAAGSSYHPISSSDCVDGRWTATPGTIPAGIVYVPCAVTIAGSGRVPAILVAEGSITVEGTAVVIDPGGAGSPALISGASGPDAVRIAGAYTQILGTTQTLNGGVTVIGTASRLRCGVVASTIKVVGATVRIEVDGGCLVP